MAHLRSIFFSQLGRVRITFQVLKKRKRRWFISTTHWIHQRNPHSNSATSFSFNQTVLFSGYFLLCLRDILYEINSVKNHHQIFSFHKMNVYVTMITNKDFRASKVEWQIKHIVYTMLFRQQRELKWGNSQICQLAAATKRSKRNEVRIKIQSLSTASLNSVSKSVSKFLTESVVFV